MRSDSWTGSWYSFTKSAVRYRAPEGPGVLAIGLAQGEWLFIRPSLQLRACLLELLSRKALVEAGDVVFSTEHHPAVPLDGRVAGLLEAFKPRWSPEDPPP